MVFFSNPDYLHSNSNWQQQLQDQQQQNQSTYGSSSSIISNPWPLLLPPPPSSFGLMGGTSPIARPGSMVELARISNISRPPGAVKCPRCGSMNTKFCYYNNRSFSQPRHWCRDCRRHWTQGGALRPIPIGGARRGNRRPRASSSSGPTASSAATPAAPPLGLDNYYDGTNYSLNGFEINGGSVGAEQWRIAPPHVLPSIEIEHVVVGLNGLEEIGHDEFDNLF